MHVQNAVSFLLSLTLTPLDIASTSPPSLNSFVSGSNNPNNPTMNDYEVEVVEIRVREGELNDIIP
jgi:hypothetical protein